MIKINAKKTVFSDGKVTFLTTLPSGRKSTGYIEYKLKSDHEQAFINIPALGDIPLQDVDEFIEAVRLAAKLANGELEID